MSQITGKLIFERYNITLNELLPHMQRGLPATTQGGELVYNIDNPMEGPTQEERFQAGIRYTNTLIKLRNQRVQHYKTILDFSEFLDGYYGISMELSKGGTTSLMKDVESFLFSEKDLLRYLNWPDDVILEPFLFKHLDIDALKIIAGRWAEDYNEKSVRVQTISIHPVAMPIPWAEVLPGQKGPKYAVVFHCPDCTRDDLPNATDSAGEHLQKVLNGEFSPYTDLWCDLTNKSKHLFYRDLFESVYRDTPPDNWISEWRFVLKYSGETIPLDVLPDAGVVLFPAPANMNIQTNETPGSVPTETDLNFCMPKHEAEVITLPIEPDKDLWSFTRKGPMWYISFDGEKEHVADCTPVRRMLPALEQPGVKFRYKKLVRDTGKSKTEPTGVSRRGSIVAEEEGLSVQENGKEKYTQRQIDAMEAGLHLQYKTYLEDQANERDKWLKVKRTAETEYPLMVKETDDGLEVIRSKFEKDSDPDIGKAKKVISRDRITFFDRIKHFQGLHEHMTRYLKIDNGIIYQPPKGSPHWQIIQQNKIEVC
jgi:hypothetical protein